MIKNIKIWLMSTMLLVPIAALANDQTDIDKKTTLVQSFQNRYDQSRNTQDIKGLKVLSAEIKQFLRTEGALSESWSEIKANMLITAIWAMIAIDTMKKEETPYYTVPLATVGIISLMRTFYKYQQTESSEIILARSILAGIEVCLE